jgi:transcription elongation factor GreA
MVEDENNVVYVTEEGLQSIKEELEYLTTEKREEMAARLRNAIAQGDLKENADYQATKEEQAFIEGRIRELEDSLRRIQVIENDGPTDVVRVGSQVTVVEAGGDEPETYNIVGVHEADPGNGFISNESPFGQAMLGAKKGDTVRVETPSGEIRLEIQAIE